MSAFAVRQNIQIRRGDDWGDEVTIEFLDGSGGPLDISGAEIWMTIRDSSVRSSVATDFTRPPVVQITSPAVVGGPGGIAIVDGPGGIARPALTPAQTKLLMKKYLTYDVSIRVATGPLVGKAKTTQVGHIQSLDENTLNA